MKKLLIVLSLVSIIYGCQQPEPQKVFTGDKQFRTTDPSKLYFKNMRSIYYYIENRPHTKVDIYWLKKYSKTKERPILYPKIVNNWMEDEAYIFIENGFYPYFPSDTIQIFWESSTQDTSGVIALSSRTKQKQYEFAGRIYDGLIKGTTYQMENSQGELVPIFEGDDRTHFMMTVKDYYRLTEVY